MLIFTSVAIPSSSILPLIILAIVIFLPGILVLLTTRKLIYVYWMLIYILALPVWNFALPVYSYWRQDDFSWGATRLVEGEAKGKGGHDSEGEPKEQVKVTRKRWAEWKKRESRSQ